MLPWDYVVGLLACHLGRIQHIPQCNQVVFSSRPTLHLHLHRFPFVFICAAVCQHRCAIPRFICAHIQAPSLFQRQCACKQRVYTLYCVHSAGLLDLLSRVNHRDTKTLFIFYYFWKFLKSGHFNCVVLWLKCIKKACDTVCDVSMIIYLFKMLWLNMSFNHCLKIITAELNLNLQHWFLTLN